MLLKIFEQKYYVIKYYSIKKKFYNFINNIHNKMLCTVNYNHNINYYLF